MKRLGEEVDVNLAVSLCAPNDELRNEIIPINRRYPLKELIEASLSYPIPNRKALTFEYVLIKDVNDSAGHAKELAEVLKGVKCKVNLIPFNEAPGLGYKSPGIEKVLEFQRILVSSGFNAKIRKNRGRDVLGACGQLAADYPLENTAKSAVRHRR